MCNIAGYVGEKRAAPILLEMIRRQQGFDGGACTGIVTYHEGRLYYRKIVGDVDTLIKTTDALSLPGTVGIAHTRPGGTTETYNFAHPFITYDETMACVTNGTSRGSTPGVSEKMLCMLENAGYKFRGEAYLYNTETKMPRLRCGAFVSGAEVRLNGVHYYHNVKGMPIPEAMARVDSELYKDGVIELLSTEEPDRITVLRTTRPAVTLKTSDGIYVANTRFAFPEDLSGELRQLPLFHPCQIFKDKIVVTDAKIDGEEVAEITERTLDEAYKRIEALLIGKRDTPLYFDDLEYAVNREMRDIFEGDHTLVQDARVVYDVLWRLSEEGRLKTRLILMEGGKRLEPSDPMYADARNVPGSKNRIFMWLED